MEYFDILETACTSVGLTFNYDKYNKFITYKNLIQEWNEKINLTSILDDDGIIKKHFIDCIKVFSFKELNNVETLIDIGTGAGFPGIPIAIMNPNLKVTLLDSLNKRVNFLKEVCDKLELKNVELFHGRAEDFARKKEFREKFDVAVSRAVANMNVLSEFCLPYVKVKGCFIALKGPAVDEEIKGSKNCITILGGSIEDIIETYIEDTDLNHNLVIVRKLKECSKTYPRKAGTVTKKPLK